MQTTLKARLPDGRCIEHSRTVFSTEQIAVREQQTHIAKAYGYWLENCLISPFDVPQDRGYDPKSAVPDIAAHLAVIDVSNEDLSQFRILHTGTETLGLGGFSSSNLNSLSPNGVHWALLLDMVWMKKDLQPVFVSTELAVESLPIHYTSLLLPLSDASGAVTRAHIVTRPIVVHSSATKEAF